MDNNNTFYYTPRPLVFYMVDSLDLLVDERHVLMLLIRFCLKRSAIVNQIQNEYTSGH